jgi:hypothetical protein
MKYLQIGLLVILLHNAVYANEGKYEIKYKLPDANELNYDTKIRSFQVLKKEQSQVKQIINKMNELIIITKGYEEVEVLRELKNLFRDKYLITNTDIIEIDRKLNETYR